MPHLETKPVDDCQWFHQTSANNAQSILKNGFIVEHGGNQRFTEGSYFLSHSGASYGDTTLRACINGNFLRIKNYPFDHWQDVKDEYYTKIKAKGLGWNYETLTDEMQHDYPNADGVVFVEKGDTPEEYNHMLVAWQPKRTVSQITFFDASK